MQVSALLPMSTRLYGRKQNWQDNRVPRTVVSLKKPGSLAGYQYSFFWEIKNVQGWRNWFFSSAAFQIIKLDLCCALLHFLGPNV